MSILFLAWQDPKSRSWFTIGKLTQDGTSYKFVYTRGAEAAQREAGFPGLKSFPSLADEYESDELFPFFANRLPTSSRSDFEEFLVALNMPQSREDPLALLALSGGRRMTDSFELFPTPFPKEDGSYQIRFFAHGLRHFPRECLSRVDHLTPGERLYLMHDFQNPHDSSALMLRTTDTFDGDRYCVGFCPRYLVRDFFKVLVEGAQQVQVVVEQVNVPPVPLQLKLLCRLVGCWPEGFEPFRGAEYQPLAGEGARIAMRL